MAKRAHPGPLERLFYALVLVLGGVVALYQAVKWATASGAWASTFALALGVLLITLVAALVVRWIALRRW